MPTAGRVVLVTTSPVTPPGLLTHRAWRVLADLPVLVAGADHPQLEALRAAGVDARVVDPAAFDDAVRRHALTGADCAALPAAGAAPAGDHEVVVGSCDPAGARLLEVVAVMDRLRSPGGCPWDAAQTHSSLRPYLLEEAYEAYQALEDGDPVALREELGDVLLQVVFHARLAQEGERPWSVDDVAGDLVDKLVRRHPHVFAGGSADDLEGSWDALKAAEKGRTSVTDGVPLGQPALALAAKLQRRAARLGAPVPGQDGLGGALWELVRRCREAGVDPEQALREVARRYRDTLAGVEQAARADGVEPAELSAKDWARRWSACP